MTDTIENTNMKTLLLQGLCIIDKPAGISSMQAVAKLKYKLKSSGYLINKIGHTGTLDPFATGMLPICIGSTTKFASLFLNSAKVYEFTVFFGQETDTGDITGQAIEKSDNIPSQADLLCTINNFKGKQMQSPHAFSAVHHNGVRAYKLARQGIKIDLPAKEIEIYEIELLEYKNSVAKIRARCSSGTYIRSLARDIAHQLNTYAYVQTLRRTMVANIKENTLSTLDQPIIIDQYELINYLNGFYPTIELTQMQAIEITHGRNIPNTFNINGTILAYYGKNILGLVDCNTHCNTNTFEPIIKPYKIVNSELLKNLMN